MVELSKYLYAVFLLSITLLATAAQAETRVVGGIELAEKIDVSNKVMTLNGAGVRSKFFIDLYVGSLFLSTASSAAAEIIAADSPMMIQLDIISERITSENMTEAILEGFENSTGDNTQPIQAEIDEFMAVFSEAIHIGDRFQLIHLPDQGMEINKNEKQIAQMPKNMAFKQALFGIWLSDKPAQSSLKKGMLGK